MKHPSFQMSLIGAVGTLLILLAGTILFQIEITLLLMLCIVYVSVTAHFAGQMSLQDMIEGMGEACSQSLIGLLFFPLVGAIIGIWIDCGTIPALVYYGLQFLNPGSFLVSAFLICSAVSAIIGTSWGTIGTVGIVIMGVAEGSSIGIPAGAIAGAIVSGAWFGDKMSPLSDSTILTAAAVNINVYHHIRGMCYTTLPAFWLSIMIFGAVNRCYTNSTQLDYHSVTIIEQILQQHYNINYLTFLPPIVLIVFCLLRAHVFVALSGGAVSGILCSVAVQHHTFAAAMQTLITGVTLQVPVPAVNNLLNQGGVNRMIPGLYLCVLAICLGGVLQKSRFLHVIITRAAKYLKSDFRLVLATMTTCVLGNGIFSDNYITIVLNAGIYRGLYKRRGLDLSMLSRTIEESATMSAPLIPWTAAGVFVAGVLGVGVEQYGTFAILNLINPMVALLSAATGIGVIRQKNEAERCLKKKDGNRQWVLLKGSLRNKLLLAFLLVGFFPALFLGFFLYSFQIKNSVAAVEETLGSSTVQVVRLLEDGIRATVEYGQTQQQARKELERLSYIKNVSELPTSGSLAVSLAGKRLFLQLDEDYLQLLLPKSFREKGKFTVKYGGIQADGQTLSGETKIWSEASAFSGQVVLRLEVEKNMLLKDVIFWGDVSIRTSFIMIILSICVACGVSYHLTSRVDALAKEMKQISDNNFSHPGNQEDFEDKNDEISMLTGTFHQMTAELDKLINKTLRLELSEREAKIKALQSQISPHFLYNALDSINWDLIQREDYGTSEILIALSEMLRYSIDNSNEQVMLREEFYQVENYLKIQHNRFPERFAYQIKCNSDVEEVFVPKMILQPLVENAISHGLEEARHGTLLVSAAADHGIVVLTVRDTGKGIAPEILSDLQQKIRQQEEIRDAKDFHIGLANVNNRVRYVYGGCSGLTLESMKNHYTQVTIYLDMREERQ